MHYPSGWMIRESLVCWLVVKGLVVTATGHASIQLVPGIRVEIVHLVVPRRYRVVQWLLDPSGAVAVPPEVLLVVVVYANHRCVVCRLRPFLAREINSV